MAESKSECISPGLITQEPECATLYGAVTDVHGPHPSTVKTETDLGLNTWDLIKTETPDLAELAHVTHVRPDQIKTEADDGENDQPEHASVLQDSDCDDIKTDTMKRESVEVLVRHLMNTAFRGAGVNKEHQTEPWHYARGPNLKSKNPRKGQSELIQDEGIVTGKKPYECPQCGKCFARKSYFNKHKKIHAGESCYKCDQCGHYFAEMHIHKRVHTGEKPYKCDHCEKSFSIRCNLTRHKRIHTGEKPYICDHCEKCFTRKTNLKSHLRIHTGERPYKCDQCEKSFSQKSDFNSHQKIHTGEKPYVCDQCEKSFVRRCDLNSHQRAHTGEKPYMCNHCEKSFGWKSVLICHQRIHTGEKPYTCTQCETCFSRKSSLKSHQKIHKHALPTTG